MTTAADVIQATKRLLDVILEWAEFCPACGKEFGSEPHGPGCAYVEARDAMKEYEGES